MSDLSEAPEQWLEKHGSALYRFALARLRDPHKAEEVVQDTLVAALQSHARFAGGSSVRTWLTGILKHKIMDQFRHEARTSPLEAPERLSSENQDVDDELFDANGSWRENVSDWGNPEDALERSQLRAILQHCLSALPERLSRLFMLSEVMEESTETICQEMDVSPTNVWTMLYRARMGLRQCLEQNGAGRARKQG
ncbi:MAG: sigma-70 family RNA polymerase sigma factor [Gammaproteobacteria bacterium]|nr:sigma-70 family RNA polymerase sigma factor [Gammaproteobacteria bacterium]MBU1408257.1 sigma-70 family RNA polymerase sigma factor [Gammaproteobacteria bacterium]MBU1533165.1 sigma-70 family RNA polymerase sigma factor [Gammaproteobacteria bacterium]